jgi:hypothetical protein
VRGEVERAGNAVMAVTDVAEVAQNRRFFRRFIPFAPPLTILRDTIVCSERLRILGKNMGLHSAC